MRAAPELVVEGVSARLGGRVVLDEVDLVVNSGEFAALIGPNGAGKTTLLRAVLGLVALDAGRVRIAGQVESRSIGYVPQLQSLNWDFPCTVHDSVLSSRARLVGWLRKPKATDRECVSRALDRVGLSVLADRPIGELSGGQRQRVLVARALALEPSLYLLDEPFAGVDPPTQESLTALFRDFADEGAAVLMSTHDIRSAAASCDSVVLLNRTVVAAGPPAEVCLPATLLSGFAYGVGVRSEWASSTS